MFLEPNVPDFVQIILCGMYFQLLLGHLKEDAWISEKMCHVWYSRNTMGVDMTETCATVSTCWKFSSSNTCRHFAIVDAWGTLCTNYSRLWVNSEWYCILAKALLCSTLPPRVVEALKMMLSKQRWCHNLVLGPAYLQSTWMVYLRSFDDIDNLANTLQIILEAL